MGAGLEGSVRPFTQEGFHDAFRQDLLQAQNHVLILSPFLAVRRAMSYYAHLQDAVRRGCRLDICTKPERELDGDLREEYPRVVTALQHIGAAVHLRPAMHEKIAILDDDILWSGSLNILSHNRTSESMLRFTLPTLIQTVLEGLQLDFLPGATCDGEPGQPQAGADREGRDGAGDGTGDGTDAAGRACPECGAPMVYYADSTMWICSQSPKCAGFDLVEQAESSTQAASGVAERSDLDPGARNQDLLPDFSCPHCGHRVRVRRGVRTRIACSNPDCDFRMDPQLSMWLLKALRHQGGTRPTC